MPLLRDYFAVILWSTLPLLLYAALRRYLQGIHAVAPVAFALVTANLVNAAAQLLLIYGHFGLPALGVPGAAWATVASRASTCWWCCGWPSRYYDRVRDSGLERRVAAHLAPAAGAAVAARPPGRRCRSRSKSPPSRWPRRWPAGSTRCRAPRTRSRSTSPRPPSWCRSASPRPGRCGSATGSAPATRSGAGAGRLDGDRARRRVHDAPPPLLFVAMPRALHRPVLARAATCWRWGRRCC